MRLAAETSIRPDQANEHLARCDSAPIAHSVKVAELAKRQGLELSALLRLAGVGDGLPADAVVTTELQLKYAGYFDRERVQADKMRRMGNFALGEELPYQSMRSVSYEARQKLGALRPRTLAQAARIPGVSPNDLQNLVLEVERHRRVAGKGGEAS